MNYRPRRSSKRWTQDAPEFVLACYDNGGRTVDRYSVLFGGSLWDSRMGRNVYVLCMSGAPTHPQGVSMWSEMPAYNRGALGKHVRWLDLPEHIRKHVIMRAGKEE